MQHLTHPLRHVKQSLAMLLAIAVVCQFISATDGPSGARSAAKTLTFYHTHTGDRVRVTFAQGDTYDADALEAINDFLKDSRNGEKIAIDPALLDFLYDLQRTLNSSGTFEVISAYRSPQTNEMLRKRSNGVARHSQHLLGKAIDVRLDDVALKKLHDTAIEMRRGGVGYYPQSNFVHLDTGRVRRW
jgi:uncharacterized protein YcbK (DUF882 family)